jgi:hypothetical protein
MDANCSEPAVDIVNPPDIHVAGDKSRVSLRISNCGYRAVKLVFKIIGFVQLEVPRSRKL